MKYEFKVDITRIPEALLELEKAYREDEKQKEDRRIEYYRVLQERERFTNQLMDEVHRQHHIFVMNMRGQYPTHFICSIKVWRALVDYMMSRMVCYNQDPYKMKLFGTLVTPSEALDEDDFFFVRRKEPY